MGSDDSAGTTPHKVWRAALLLLRHPKPLISFMVRIVVLLWVASVAFQYLAPPPEAVYQPTFSAEEGLQRIPKRCHDVAQQFYQTQQHSKPKQQTLVIACHRRWCHAWLGGHCEPCGGIGDRMRFVLKQTQEASKAGRRVLLDYTLQDMAILDSALYFDKAGWWGELFHFRSYRVSERQPVVWNDDDGMVQFAHAKANVLLASRVPYDICYFHALFQPASPLQKDLDRHMANLNALTATTQQTRNLSIGIHFRTGDQAAFGVANQDTRLVTNWQEGWDQMYKCALELSRRLGKQANEDSSGNITTTTFFLATDHAELKRKVQRDAQQQQRKQADPSTPSVYVTEPLPHSYLRGVTGDRDAWMEIYLLSMQHGLVVNLRPETTNYKGKADRTSYFAVLAQQIGGLRPDQVMECRLD